MLRLTRNMSILPASRTHRHWNTGCPKSFKMVVAVFICPHWKQGICAHTTSGDRSCGQDEGKTGRRPLRRAQCSAAARPPLSGCCSTFFWPQAEACEASQTGLPAPCPVKNKNTPFCHVTRVKKGKGAALAGRARTWKGGKHGPEPNAIECAPSPPTPRQCNHTDQQSQDAHLGTRAHLACVFGCGMLSALVARGACRCQDTDAAIPTDSRQRRNGASPMRSSS